MPASTALRLAAAVLAALLVGCAAAPPAPVAPTDALFDDALFVPPDVAIDAEAALAPSAAMRARLAALRTPGRRGDDPRRILLEALAGRGDERLRLEYDASVTRTAAEAFEARKGNCLALVLVTAAFAHELGVPVRFQSVVGRPEWTHAGGFALAVGHVNVALDAKVAAGGRRWEANETLVVDFLPSPQAERLRIREIGERTVVAMYLNNRAVEALADDRVDDAYWWARESVRQDPAFDAAAVTLGVVYRQRHRPDLAAAALQRVLDRDPLQPDALADLALVLRELGRVDEAAALDRQLARLGGAPPFSAFDAGIAAYRDGRFDLARHWFADALQQPSDRERAGPDAEFWLARTFARQNDLDEARRHLDLALAASGTRTTPSRYAAKLERLRALADAASP